MLDSLSQRLARVVKTMRGEARLTEANTQEMLREIRIALLEADVALPVVRDFIAKVKEKALGAEVLQSLTPGQALVGEVHKTLTELMGGATAELELAAQPPAVILMAGLQGSGKTTTVGKLARWLRQTRKKKVLTVSCDVYRPAAIDQLKTVAAQAGADFMPSTPDQKPVDIARAALAWAKNHYHDVLIVDTAGRLGIDEAMMTEIGELHRVLRPIETLFVVDAMQGQDAVNTAKAFNETLPLTGVVLTKLDGDSRGGAALSVKAVTGKPIKFVGVGEKLDGLDVFHPERMANRILGMGDIVALVEQAQANVDQEAARGLAEKLKGGSRFDLDDFLQQISQMKKMGGLSSLLDKLPAQMQGKAGPGDLDRAEREIRRMQGIIHAMTAQERQKPELIKASRKRRIAAGSGVPVQEVNRLLNQFSQMQAMMRKMQKGGLAKMMRSMKGMMGGMGGIGGMGGMR
ncbi:MAG: signal recognition particle protein [Burkholderiaceae bacterium]|nr:signal recognition particle protein [Burkholderiaceae bacterium]